MRNSLSLHVKGDYDRFTELKEILNRLGCDTPPYATEYLIDLRALKFVSIQRRVKGAPEQEAFEKAGFKFQLRKRLDDGDQFVVVYKDATGQLLWAQRNCPYAHQSTHTDFFGDSRAELSSFTRGRNQDNS